MDIPFEERLNYLTEEYGKQNKSELVTAIMRIQKRLGGLETKNAINYLLENDFKESFRILLKYYDKWYEKGLYNRENVEELIKKIELQVVDNAINTTILINHICPLNVEVHWNLKKDISTCKKQIKLTQYSHMKLY